MSTAALAQPSGQQEAVRTPASSSNFGFPPPLPLPPLPPRPPSPEPNEIAVPSLASTPRSARNVAIPDTPVGSPRAASHSGSEHYINDQTGLDRAYAAPNNVYFDAASSTLYISGTHVNENNTGIFGRFSDYFTDAMLPTQTLRLTDRYNQAREAFERYHPSNVVGHSLGANIASTLTSDFWGPAHEGVAARYYNAPFAPGRVHRNYESSFSHYGDPISAGDLWAERTFALDVHGYGGHTASTMTRRPRGRNRSRPYGR